MLKPTSLLKLLSLLPLFHLLGSCHKKSLPQSTGSNPALTVPDYASLTNWAAHPGKIDPSDSIPEPLRKYPSHQIADVFFLHPTTFTNSQDTSYDNAPIDDVLLNHKTDYRPILYQASIFNAVGRVYAPRYRQAHLRMYYITDTARARTAFDTAYADIRRAFAYYLQYENQRRPIIIASHSQGTTHAKRLLKEFFDDNPTLRKQLVVAYLLGIAVEKNAYAQVKPCQDSTSTGCFIGWRTYRKSYKGPYVSKTDTTISVTNPYTWTSDPTSQPSTLHQGAVLYRFNKVYPHTQSATIAGNALWVSRPKFPGGLFYTSKNYHAGDFNLFYLDVRQDAARRVRRFIGLNHP